MRGAVRAICKVQPLVGYSVHMTTYKKAATDGLIKIGYTAYTFSFLLYFYFLKIIMNIINIIIMII